MPFTDHDLKREQLFVRYLDHILNNRPFDDLANGRDLNTALVCNSDPNCFVRTFEHDIDISNETIIDRLG